MQQVQQAGDDEDEVLVVDTESESDSSEETDSESEIEIVTSHKEEDTVRQPVPMTSDNLATLIRSLQGGDGDPPSISTADIQETADVTEESAPKKQRTNTAPDNILSGPSTTSKTTPSVDPQPDPPTADASKKTDLEDIDFYDFNFDFETTPSRPGSSSGGIHFEAGSSSGAHTTEHDEAAFRYASEKRQVDESDSDEEEYVKRLKRRVVILEQDGELKSAQIVSL
ncbi:hypothetical protein HanRHA438_Chr01g0025871 [Helianthus annuus]|nr:hypothetical protein HanHA300_Chr01g0020321 [Helianthus annuus]KAJ0948325.1 hypothetical protein HanRHA438_Chr01g0025871 [Helianthus annuus]